MQMRRSKAAAAVAAVVAVAALAACADDPAPVGRRPSPVPVSTTVTDTQVLTTGVAYAQCLRDLGASDFPEPVVRDGRLAWADPATAQRAKQALGNTAARNACQPILDPMPATRLWPAWPPLPGTDPGPPTRSAGCDRPPPARPGTSTRQTIASTGGNRAYLLHLPRGYGNDAGLPVVLAFHGATSRPEPNIVEDMEQETGLSELADRETFIVAYPRSTTVDDGRTGWNTGSKEDPTVDDVRFVEDLLDHLNETVCVDPRRVYATGFSSGGGLTGILACRAANRIAAFAAVSGAFFVPGTPCAPARPVPILEIHGTSDKVPYEGGPFGPDTLAPIPQWLANWAERDHCARGPTTFFEMIDVIAERWSRCTGASTVIGYRILNGGHTWPGAPTATQTVNASALAWGFFRTQRLP
jgi:polyhydroxybutyrate depolymerase